MYPSTYRELRQRCFDHFKIGEKRKNCAITRAELVRKLLSFDAITAVSYNLSYASQLNTAMGSEMDFVQQCQNVKRLCYEAALENIQRIDEDFNIDVLGIQEAEDPNMIPKITSRIPSLDSHYRSGVWNSNVKKYVGALLMWNSQTLGAQKSASTINLDPKDGRVCGIVTTDKDITLIVAHFPWMRSKKDVETMETLITPHVRHTNIIMMADTNDAKTLIHSKQPFVVAGQALSQNMTRHELRRRLKTCCWHEKGHKDGNYSDTGDYVLARRVLSLKIPYSQPSNETTETNLFSDHAPVVARVALE